MTMNFFRKQIAQNLKHPQRSIAGYFAKKRMVKRNAFLAEQAVKLCDIEPHHNVLEVGFGPGLGLKEALKQIKGDNGQVCGIDVSTYMVDHALKKFKNDIGSGYLEIVQGTVSRLPYNSNQFDRVFHINSYYFWENMALSCSELYRVMKPNSLMVTALNLSRLKEIQRDFDVSKARTDPLLYMYRLEAAGFRDVNIQYLEDKGKKFEAIFASIYEKPELEYYGGVVK